MDLSTFIVSVFCLIDDRLKGRRIRQRGPTPKLSDAEVLTIKEHLWQDLLSLVPHDPDFAIGDSMPLPERVCLLVPTVVLGSAVRLPLAKIRSSNRPSTAIGCT